MEQGLGALRQGAVPMAKALHALRRWLLAAPSPSDKPGRRCAPWRPGDPRLQTSLHSKTAWFG